MDICKRIEEQKDQLVEDTAALIRCPSLKAPPLPGKPYGEGVAQALDCILEMGRRMGFSVRSGGGHYGVIDFGDSDDYVAVLAHLDVVPQGTGWDYDPFGGVVADGKLYGRGSIDDKGPAVAALYAMKALKDSGFVPSKKIRLVVGCDEEDGWGCMKAYVANEPLPVCGFTPDAEYPMIYAEKGICQFRLTGSRRESSPLFELVSLRGGDAVNVVCSLCQAALRPAPGKAMALHSALLEEAEKLGDRAAVEEKDGLLLLTVRGVPAHGSTPEKGQNAISSAMELLSGLYRRSGGTSSLADFYCNTLLGDTQGRALGVAFEDTVSGKLSCNVGIVQVDYAAGDGEEIRIDIRYPVTMGYQDLCQRLEATCRRYGWTSQVLSHKAPISTDPNSPLAQVLMEVYREETGLLDSKPIAIGGGTYARAMPNIAAFGPVFEGEAEVAHQQNEYISVDSLVKNCRIYAKALQRLAQ